MESVDDIRKTIMSKHLKLLDIQDLEDESDLTLSDSSLQDKDEKYPVNFNPQSNHSSPSFTPISSMENLAKFSDSCYDDKNMSCNYLFDDRSTPIREPYQNNMFILAGLEMSRETTPQTAVNRLDDQEDLEETKSHPFVHSSEVKFSSQQSGVVTNMENEPENFESKDDKMPKFGYILYSLFILVQLLINFDQGVMPAILSRFEVDYGMNEIEQGIIGALPFISIAISWPFWAPILQKYNEQRALSISLLLNGPVVYLLCISAYIAQFDHQGAKAAIFISRFCLGLTQAGFTIYIPLWINKYSPSRALSFLFGIFLASAAIGTMIGYAATTPFALAENWTELELDDFLKRREDAINAGLLLYPSLPSDVKTINSDSARLLQYNIPPTFTEFTCLNLGVKQNKKKLFGFRGLYRCFESKQNNSVLRRLVLAKKNEQLYPSNINNSSIAFMSRFRNIKGNSESGRINLKSNNRSLEGTETINKSYPFFVPWTYGLWVQGTLIIIISIILNFFPVALFQAKDKLEVLSSKHDSTTLDTVYGVNSNKMSSTSLNKNIEEEEHEPVFLDDPDVNHIKRCRNSITHIASEDMAELEPSTSIPINGKKEKKKYKKTVGPLLAVKLLIKNGLWVYLELLVALLFFTLAVILRMILSELEVQYWSTKWLLSIYTTVWSSGTVIQTSGYFGQATLGQVQLHFQIVASTSPVAGVIIGGILFDRPFMGNIETKEGQYRRMKLIAALVLIAGICSVVVASATSSYPTVIIFLWGMLFFGACAVPALAALPLKIIPSSLHPHSSALNVAIQNVLGFGLGTWIPGLITHFTNGQLLLGMTISLLCTVLGIPLIIGALYEAKGLRDMENNYLEKVISEQASTSSKGVQNWLDSYLNSVGQKTLYPGWVIGSKFKQFMIKRKNKKEKLAEFGV